MIIITQYHKPGDKHITHIVPPFYTIFQFLKYKMASKGKLTLTSLLAIYGRFLLLIELFSYILHLSAGEARL
jgi:hypothetical protein